MPEGDTIHRSAAVLRTMLVGKPIVAFEAERLVGPQPTVGATVESVEAHGKHLEITFDDGIVLHTHMRMTGAWHLYRDGERWRRNPSAARAVLDIPGWTAVCFSAPVVETFRVMDRRRHPGLGSLGPDLCLADADLDECVDRMARFGEHHQDVAEVLLDQRIACGVGNVYKSEVLWACALDPFTPLAQVPVRVRRDLIATASRMLRANLDNSGRTTVTGPPGSLAVYGQHLKPCRRCATPIEWRKHGVLARITFWCPGCQRVPAIDVTDHRARLS
ncbi:MAG: DNA-formamidopyrimidine glycosylase family protein [Acidimicrobiales bacterium]